LLGTQQAGSIATASGNTLAFGEHAVPLRYALELNDDLSREARFVTLAHELGHLYCGHLGRPNSSWWPDRRGLARPICEFEAESVAFLVCSRIGIDNPSEQYLAGYVKEHEQVPAISLDCMLKSASLIETMAKDKLHMRKKRA
jgi:antirestriction protein ArdC